jgi:hypothetical protein
MPVDAEPPLQGGNVQLEWRGREANPLAHVLSVAEAVRQAQPAHQPHADVCTARAVAAAEGGPVMTDAPPLLIRTSEQYQIALAYARGRTAVQIAAELGATQAAVDSVIEAVGFDRGRARAALVEYDRRRAAVAAAKGGPAASVPATSAPAAAVVTDPAARSLEALLAAAEQSTVPRVRNCAERIRRQVEELTELVRRAQVEENARRLVAQRRQELDEARAQLRRITEPQRKPAASKPRAARKPADPEQTAARAWAKANGIRVHPHGQVGPEILAAYRKAQVT